MCISDQISVLSFNLHSDPDLQFLARLVVGGAGGRIIHQRLDNLILILFTFVIFDIQHTNTHMRLWIFYIRV